jgi:succinoglycan biosynthesis protein ExoM
MKSEGELLLVGICTYKRPNMLSLLLDACAKLESVPGLQLSVLIVDNDPEGSARGTAEAARARLPMQIYYVVEAERGIANARNRVLEEALLRNAALLAFIDDDEVMRPDWLRALYQKMQETSADAVGSDVFWDLPRNAPAWAHALPVSPKYEELYGRTGKKKPRKFPSTNNVLMKARIFGELRFRFDARYGLGSGEDTDFFIRAMKAGVTYAFAPEAAIVEHVPPSRLNLRWLFSRWTNFSSVNVKMHVLHHGRGSAWRRFFLHSVSGLVTGVVILGVAPIAGPRTMLRGLKHLSGSIGTMRALFGRVADEYRTIHGS